MTFNFNNVDRYNKLFEGLWKKESPVIKKYKEEKEMNADKIVELFYDRKIEKIRERIKMEEENEINENEFVKRYQEIINEFEAKMDELYTEVTPSVDPVLLKTGYDYSFKYEISESFKSSVSIKFREKFEEEIKPLKEERSEVMALLRISEDKDFVLKVLTDYNILDKKGKVVNE